MLNPHLSLVLYCRPSIPVRTDETLETEARYRQHRLTTNTNGITKLPLEGALRHDTAALCHARYRFLLPRPTCVSRFQRPIPNPRMRRHSIITGHSTGCGELIRFTPVNVLQRRLSQEATVARVTQSSSTE